MLMLGVFGSMKNINVVFHSPPLKQFFVPLLNDSSTPTSPNYAILLIQECKN